MSPKKNIKTSKSYASTQEAAAYERLNRLFRKSPLPPNEVTANLGLFLTRGSFSRILFLHDLYLKILNTHGIIIEFGVRWGQSLALFTTFRHLYEPYNLSRKIVGFDSFAGFPSISKEDGRSEAARPGTLSVTQDYDLFLDDLLAVHEELAPRSQEKKFALVKGDVVETLPRYLKNHPETIIALAYFDLTLYEPTKRCLELIRPHLVRNSIVGFDELVFPEFPGETQALKDSWGLTGFRLHRHPAAPQQSYLTFD